MTAVIDFAPDFVEKIRDIRRDIHAHPELAYEEHRTAGLIAGTLEEAGIEVMRGIGGTGLVAILKNGSGNGCVALRADMDALPMQELNAFAHASKNEGVMHACGHDGHCAMLLGALLYLHQTRAFSGTILGIFQPAEESYGGALRMIEDGLFEKFPIDAVFGMHNWPDFEAGEFAVRTGPLMGSSNSFHLKITGKGGHGAQPNHTIDPVMTAVQIAQSWQTIITRNKAPVETAVLSITQIHAGSAFNVVPDDAFMAGTVRTFSTEALDLIETRMREIAEHTAAAFNCEADFVFQRGYPPLVNYAAETAFAVEVMTSLVGKEKLYDETTPTMTAEDFSFFLVRKPGAYVFIGNGNGEHRSKGHGNGPCRLHNPSYDFNDSILPLGMTYWIRLAEQYLNRA